MHLFAKTNQVTGTTTYDNTRVARCYAYTIAKQHVDKQPSGIQAAKTCAGIVQHGSDRF